MCRSLDLAVLRDDKLYLPAYNVAPVISKRVLDRLLQPVRTS